jgi:YVTN family beta-propeller protein
VSVISTKTNTVVGLPILVGQQSIGVAITPDRSKVYVANENSDTASVISTATNMVVAVPPVGKAPVSFGVFIQPRFAGTPGKRACYGKSISALARTFDGLHRATIALGFPTVEGRQTAVNVFCSESACDEEDRRACMTIGENWGIKPDGGANIPKSSASNACFAPLCFRLNCWPKISDSACSRCVAT